MRKTVILLMGICLGVQMMRAEAFPVFGVDSVSSEFFREWYQNTDLRHYLDNYSDYVTYEAETTGEWGLPEQMVFSINGNSYRSNRLYLNGFRVDSRFQSGSTWLELNMQEHSLLLNQHRGAIEFVTDSLRKSRVRLSNNMGGLRGINPSTQRLINLYHQTASQRTQEGNDLTSRDYIQGAGQAEVTYGIPFEGGRVYQHAYANWGQRMINAFDQRGISGQYRAPYYKVQLDGQLPLRSNAVLDCLNYYLLTQKRNDLFSEFMFGEEEVATQHTYSAALYGTKDFGPGGVLTTGINWAMNDVRHNNLSFSRNIIDQDGEGFEPWYADGLTNEVNWAVNYHYELLPWLHLHLDAYNSLMHFRPTTDTWTNDIYSQDYAESTPTSLCQYTWTAGTFTSGLLENQLTLNARKRLGRSVEVQAQLAATLDAVILGSGRSVVSPNWEAMAGIHISNDKWFAMDVTLGHFRTRYSYEDVLYLSPEYMNGVATYAESGQVFQTMGGRYHTPAAGLRQPSYAMLDLPVRFFFDSRHGRHEFSLLSSLRLYYDQWTTRFAGDAGQYGLYDNGIFYYNASVTQYEVVQMSDSHYPDHFLMRNPLWLSNVAKYSYTGRHVFVSFSWQSYLLSGVSALGNGPLQNNLNALSESTANPNTLLNGENAGEYHALGRLDQDRSFIARMQFGWRINDHWSLSVTGKFKDGTPFSNFRTAVYTSAAGTQMAVYNMTTKGINIIDNHFGRRKDAFFNFDLHARYRGAVKGIPVTLDATCYNVYDWGTELVEYTFEDQLTGGLQRRALQLNIPRGIILTMSIGLEKE